MIDKIKVNDEKEGWTKCMKIIVNRRKVTEKKRVKIMTRN